MVEAQDIDPKHQGVLQTLFRFHGSMPFLELTSVSDLDDEQLDKIVSELERKKLVKVNNPQDVIEKIVSLTSDGYSQFERFG